MKLEFHADLAVQNAAKDPSLRKPKQKEGKKNMSKKPLVDGTQMHVISVVAFSDGYVLWAEHGE